MRPDRPESRTIWTVGRALDASDLPRRATKVGREIIERTGTRDGLEVSDDVFGFPASILFESASSSRRALQDDADLLGYAMGRGGFEPPSDGL